MPSTINRILDDYPFQTISPIVWPPNFETFSELYMKLNSAAVSVQSNLGNGTINLLYLTISTTFYTTLSVTAYIVLVSPSSEPIILDGTTGPAIVDLHYAFQLAKDIFIKYDQIDK